MLLESGFYSEEASEASDMAMCNSSWSRGHLCDQNCGPLSKMMRWREVACQRLWTPVNFESEIGAITI